MYYCVVGIALHSMARTLGVVYTAVGVQSQSQRNGWTHEDTAASGSVQRTVSVDDMHIQISIAN